ncbi:hypothetical protein 30R [Ranavirus ambystoma1]|uniref:Uncharacterized protein n=1 Tax=Ranavirus ambystoma1 TaxID=265294 RepID=A0A0U2HZV1_9VIRU|nr:hypothetical protein 30R [Ambystoma tigrinum virus]
MFDASHIVRKDRGWGAHLEAFQAPHRQSSSPIMLDVGSHGKGGSAVLREPNPRPHTPGHAGFRDQFSRAVSLAPLTTADNIMAGGAARGVHGMGSGAHKDPPPAPAGMENAYSRHKEAFRAPEPVATGHSLSRVPVGPVHGSQITPGNLHVYGRAAKHLRPTEDIRRTINVNGTAPEAARRQYLAAKSATAAHVGGPYAGAMAPSHFAVPTSDRLEVSAEGRPNVLPFRPETMHHDRTTASSGERLEVSAGGRRNVLPFRPETMHHDRTTASSGERLEVSAEGRPNVLPFRPETMHHDRTTASSGERLEVSAGGRRNVLPFRPETMHHDRTTASSGERLEVSAGGRRNVLPFRPETMHHSSTTASSAERLDVSAGARPIRNWTATPVNRSHPERSLKASTAIGGHHTVSAAPTVSAAHVLFGGM